MANRQEIRVVELFAGVGGFRLGLERCSPRFRTVWADQWEPGQAGQWAYRCYCRRFGEAARCCNEDIAAVTDQAPAHDLLVGGFPCQDYSVARTGAEGIEGKKGVLWWSIYEILRARRPRMVLLENVDRLLKSPARQRGRDFGVMLRCLVEAGYRAEWRVVNAADYGNAQRRRRVFLFATRDPAPAALRDFHAGAPGWLVRDGFFSGAFPVLDGPPAKQGWADVTAGRDLAELSDTFSAAFSNAGVMVDGRVYTQELTPRAVPPTPLADLLEPGGVDERYYLRGETLEKWRYLKGAKRVLRTAKTGYTYWFTEGTIPFPDPADRPGRTMLTSEGSLNRSTHIVVDPATGELRKLTPVECERLNGFPDGWTDTGMPERQRYFVMGNALVVPVVTRMGARLLELL